MPRLLTTAGSATTDAGHAAPEHTWRASVSLCLDDYGLHGGVNAAALTLVEMGRVGALACMVGAPGWKAGSAALRAPQMQTQTRGVDLGLHLDLTEFPLVMAPRRLPALIAAAWLRRSDRRALRAEVRAQLETFEQALGRAPDFVDGHQHVHQLPGVRDVLLDELQRRGPARPWLRSTRCPPGASTLACSAKARFIGLLGAEALSRSATARGHRQNRHLLGVYAFDTDGAGYRRLLAEWLATAADADLLICHAGVAGAWPGDPIAASRAVEFAVLASADFGDLLSRCRVRLQRMSDLLAVGAGIDTSLVPASP